MNAIGQVRHVGYIVKMFPRLSETFILNEILELERQGMKVTIFSVRKPNEGRFHPQLSELKAQVFYLEGLDPKKWTQWIGPHWPYLKTRKKEFFNLIEASLTGEDPMRFERVCQSAKIAAEGGRLNIDHWHAHFATLPSTLAWFVSQLSGTPFSFTAHAKDIYVYRPEEHQLHEKLHAAARVVTVTDFNRKHLLATCAGLAPEQIELLHNGIDLNHFRPGSGSVSTDDPLKILAVGRLVEKKGFDILLQAVAILRDEDRNVSCCIVGQGPEEDRLRAQAQDLRLKNSVTFAGALHRDEVLEEMHTSTTLCQPCVVAADGNQDALPTVLLEALACGLPVVSTRVSGIPEIIDSGVNGELVPPNDPEQLAIALWKILSQPKLRSKYALAGRRKAEQSFDLKKNVQTLRSIFESCHGCSRATQVQGAWSTTEDAHVG